MKKLWFVLRWLIMHNGWKLCGRLKTWFGRKSISLMYETNKDVELYDLYCELRRRF